MILVYLNSTNTIITCADTIVRETGTRDSEHIAKELGFAVKEVDFDRLKGIYKVIKRNRFIFIKKSLHEIMRRIVLLHESGHDQLHRKETTVFAAYGYIRNPAILHNLLSPGNNAGRNES